MTRRTKFGWAGVVVAALVFTRCDAAPAAAQEQGMVDRIVRVLERIAAAQERTARATEQAAGRRCP